MFRFFNFNGLEVERWYEGLRGLKKPQKARGETAFLENMNQKWKEESQRVIERWRKRMISSVLA